MDTNYAVAPGEYLQESLDEHDLTQQQLAVVLGSSRKHVSEVLHGNAPVTPETALRLQRVTGIPMESWQRYEAAYRADLTRLRDDHQLAQHVDKIDPSVTSYLRAHGYTSATRAAPGRLVADFLTFHRCGTFDAWTAMCEASFQGDYGLAALRENRKQPHPSALSTWLRAGELTDAFEAGRGLEYSADRLSSVLPGLRQRCAQPDANLMADAARMLREAGVVLLLVPPPAKFPLYGITRWIDKRRPVVQQTGRRGKDGFTIWTLFHEIGHVLNDPRGDVHLEYTTDRSRKTAAERGANRFAFDTLFGSAGLEPFKGLTRDRDIRAAAQQVGVSPGLAVHQMHRTHLLDYSFGNQLSVDLQPQPSE